VTIDAAVAVQEAFYLALSVPAVTEIAPVMQHVPEGTKPPLVRVGNIELAPEGGKGDGLDRATVQVLTYVREPSRAALYALMKEVRFALDGVEIASPGAELSPPVFEGQSDDLLEDGQTYEGTQVFSCFVQEI
jgi:hypothetical protein